MEGKDPKRASVANLISKFGNNDDKITTTEHKEEKLPVGGRKWTRPISIPANELEIINELKSNSQVAIKIDANGTTLAHRACANGHLHVLAQLKSMQYLVPKEDSHGLTCLHLAVKLARADVINYFSENMPEAFKWLAKNGQSILHTAVIENRTEIIKSLLPKKEMIGSMIDKLGNHLTHYINSVQMLQVLNESNCLNFAVFNRQGLPPIVHYFLKRNTPRDVIKEALKLDQFQHDQTATGDGLLHLFMKEKRGSVNEVIELFNEVTGNDESALARYIDRWDKNSNAAMHVAASIGDFDALAELDSLGGNFNVRTRNGASILHVALQHGQLECSLKIVAYFPELLTSIDYNGHSALRYALEAHMDQLVPFLIKEGVPVDLDLDTTTGENLLHVLVNTRGPHVELVQSVIKLDQSRASKLMTARDINGLTPLHLAINRQYIGIATELMQHCSENTIDSHGNTLYHYAWMSDNPMFVNDILTLLETHVKSIMPDQRNSDGLSSIDIAAQHCQSGVTDAFLKFYKACGFMNTSTPFANERNLAHVAAVLNSKPIILYAIHEGISLHVKDVNGQLPIDVAIERGHVTVFGVIVRELVRANALSCNDSPHLIAAIVKSEHFQLFEVLAEENLLPLELVIKDKPAIYLFSELGLYASVNKMLSLGADPNTVHHLSSCLHQAVKSSHVHIVRLLLTYGANANIDPTAHGNTPLKIIVDRFFCPATVASDESHPQWKEIGTLLLEHGADPSLEATPASPIMMAQLALRVFQNDTLYSMLVHYARALTLDIFAEFFPYLDTTVKAQTVQIVRKNIIDYFVQLFYTMSAEQLQAPLMLSFIGEDGVDGGGLKSEAYSLFFRELISDKRLFESYHNAPYLPTAITDREHRLSDEDRKIYHSIGRIMFRVAIVDRIPIGVQFPNFFFRYLKKGNEAEFSLADLKNFDAELFNGISSVLRLDLPSNSTSLDWDFEDGSDHDEYVTNENKSDFVYRKVRYVLIGSRIDALGSIRDGFFDSSYNYKMIESCEESLLRLLICGRESIDTKLLLSSIEFSRFEVGSKTPSLVLDLIHEFNDDQKRKFVHYITGLNTLPTKIDKKILVTKYDEERALPMSSTCGWTLYLPDYGDKQLIADKLQYAWDEAYASGFTRI